jgi:hypothetical protein
LSNSGIILRVWRSAERSLGSFLIDEFLPVLMMSFDWKEYSAIEHLIPLNDLKLLPFTVGHIDFFLVPSVKLGRFDSLGGQSICTKAILVKHLLKKPDSIGDLTGWCFNQLTDRFLFYRSQFLLLFERRVVHRYLALLMDSTPN